MVLKSSNKTIHFYSGVNTYTYTNTWINTELGLRELTLTLTLTPTVKSPNVLRIDNVDGGMILMIFGINKEELDYHKLVEWELERSCDGADQLIVILFSCKVTNDQSYLNQLLSDVHIDVQIPQLNMTDWLIGLWPRWRNRYNISNSRQKKIGEKQHSEIDGREAKEEPKLREMFWLN